MMGGLPACGACCTLTKGPSASVAYLAEIKRRGPSAVPSPSLQAGQLTIFTDFKTSGRCVLLPGFNFTAL